MEPDSHVQNPLVSQTQLEHRDLIQYECNLAACYEAEYLLSLKIQEELRQQRGALYDDPSEVTCTQFSNTHSGTAFGAACTTSLNASRANGVYFAQAGAMNSMECSHGDSTIASQFLSGVSNTYENGHTRLRSSEDGQYLVTTTQGQLHSGTEDRAEMDTDIFSWTDECGAGEDHLIHQDGPSRKKMCLNRAEY